MKTARNIKLTTLAIAAVMLAACGGGGDYTTQEADSGRQTGSVNPPSGGSTSNNTSIGGITVNNVEDNGSVYREIQP